MDAERRILERRAAAGDPDADAQLLLARVRLGELRADRLELAAELGHPAARRALGRGEHEEEQDLREWLWGFLGWGHEPIVLAIVAGCRELLLERDTAAALLQEPLDSLLAWCDDPTFAPREAARVALEVAENYVEAEDTSFGTIAWPLYRAAWAAVRSASGASDKPIRDDLTLALRGLRFTLADEELRRAIRATLIEWALKALRGRPYA